MTAVVLDEKGHTVHLTDRGVEVMSPGNDQFVLPDVSTGIGRIEATDQSLVMGFTDDVVVQVKGDDTRAQIDVRSVSRYGMHDLGANAARIRALFEEITTTLEKGEKTVLEQAKPKEEAAPAKKDATRKRVKKRVKKRRPVTR